jgi:predicted DNA binding protein
MQYVTVDGESPGPIRDALADHPDVRSVDVLTEESPTQLQVRIAGAVPEAHLAARGVVVHATTADADGARIDIELPARDAVRSTVDALEAAFDDVSVVAVTARDAPDRTGSGFGPGTADLTEKQAQALQAAYYQGYFEQPRRRSASEVAESLEVTHSTFLHHLRAAQRKVFGTRLP